MSKPMRVWAIERLRKTDGKPYKHRSFVEGELYFSQAEAESESYPDCERVVEFVEVVK